MKEYNKYDSEKIAPIFVVILSIVLIIVCAYIVFDNINNTKKTYNYEHLYINSNID